jgi:hypothetical protein
MLISCCCNALIKIESAQCISTYFCEVCGRPCKTSFVIDKEKCNNTNWIDELLEGTGK